MKVNRFRIDEIPGCSIDCSLNKEFKGDVKEIRIVAVLDDELEFGKHLNVTKRVQYQSGIKIDMNDICFRNLLFQIFNKQFQKL